MFTPLYQATAIDPSTTYALGLTDAHGFGPDLRDLGGARHRACPMAVAMEMSRPILVTT
jgi:hypothetical protein